MLPTSCFDEFEQESMNAVRIMSVNAWNFMSYTVI